MEKPRNKRLSPIIGITISFLTLILCLGSLELIAYQWEKGMAQEDMGWTLVASRRLSLERHGSPETPYYLMTPAKNYTWEGIPVEINAYGLRGPDFVLPKPAGVIRILNLGDSIAFGWEVPYEETYGVQLAHLLQKNGLSVEVINAGVPTWNLEAERNFLTQEGLSYQPDLVILDITLVNDIYGVGPSISEQQTLNQWLRDHTYFWPFLTMQMRFLLARQVGPEAIPVLNPSTDAIYYYPTDVDSPVWDEICSTIEEIAAACQRRDIPFLIVVFPTALQVNSSDHPPIPQDILSERAQISGYPVVDLLPIYKDVCAQAAHDACEGFENLLFVDVWMHPNALGHRLTAEALALEVQALIGHMPSE